MRARRERADEPHPPSPSLPAAGSREGKLAADLCAAVKDGNGDAFGDAIYNYDQISKLDPWKTNVLLKIKQALAGGAGGEGGDGDGIM